MIQLQDASTPDLVGAEAGRGAVGGAPALSVVLPEVTLRPDNPALWSRGIRRARSVPILGHVGLNGQGKTFAMIRSTLPSLAMGRRVLSTVELLNPDTGNPHPLYVPFHSWSQLEEFRDGDVLLDEVTGIMDSRDQGMPKKIRRLLPQMRRRNVMVRWTGIDWDNSDRRLRQLTQAVVKCKGAMPNRQAVRVQDGDVVRDAISMWAPNRLFLLTTYDAQTLTSSEDTRMLSQDESKKRRARVLQREWVWGPGQVAFKSYNTLAEVSGVDASCEHCGGRVPERVCKGH